MPKVEVCFTPDKFDLYFDGQPIVVVIDVLRATSAICAGLNHGVKSFIPVATLEEAKEYQSKGFIVAAERQGQIVEGFELGNSPYGFMNDALIGKDVVISTTNGTKAVQIASKAETVVIASLLNLDAVVNYLHKQQKDVLVLGSGWKNKFNLEDTICAGAIADELQLKGFSSENDSTLSSIVIYKGAANNPFSFLKASSHRRRLKALNLNEDIKYCLKPNQANVVPILSEQGRLVCKD